MIAALFLWVVVGVYVAVVAWCIHELWDELRSPICWVRFLWRSYQCGTWVSGHEYVEVDTHTLKCTTCGYLSRAE